VCGSNGGAGLAYYQERDFSISSSTIVLSPKDELKLDKKTGIYIAEELSKYKEKYSRGVQWNRSMISNDTIELPIKNNVIDYKFIYSLFE
jgi:hypothetical protein